METTLPKCFGTENVFEKDVYQKKIEVFRKECKFRGSEIYRK